MALALSWGMKLGLFALRLTAGLVAGYVLGTVVTSPTVSAMGLLPSLTLASPGNGTNVSGTITFVAIADSAGLSSLQFKVDGQPYGNAIVSNPCRASFATTNVPDGPHTVQAEGQDQFGNTVVSQPSTVFVNNLAPSVTNVAVSNTTATSATISWATAVPADSQVEYGLSASYGAASPRDFSLVQSHIRTVSGLTPSTTYHFRVLSVAQNGTLSTSGDFVFATAAGSPGPTPTPTPTPTPGPSPTPTPTPTPGPTPPFNPNPTPTPIPTPGPSPTPTPSPVPPPTGPTGPTGGTNLAGTTLPTIRPTVPQVVVSPEGSVAPSSTTTGSAPQPRVSTSSAALTSSTHNSSAPKTAKPAGTNATTSNTSTTTSKTTSTAPATSTTSGPRAVVTVEPAKVPCSKPDPFAADGGVGLCVSGYWMELWKAPARRSGK